jgi:pimeloyl-ACP methyl ester carboxylesterase
VETGDQIHVTRVGIGPTVVLVHGAMTTSGQSWAKQQPLAERWTLVLPDRRGYEPNPPAERSDFEVDAADIVPLLGNGGHLLGHSYGAMCALFAAASRPRAVRSLSLIEPPAHGVARGHPEVEAQIADFSDRHDRLTEPEAFFRAFLNRIGAPTDRLQSPMPADMERRVRLLMNERPPWDRSIPVQALRDGGFPVLIVSGGHNPTFEMICDRLSELIGARSQRAVITGAGHVVQRTGEPFNEVFERFLLAAEALAGN